MTIYHIELAHVEDAMSGGETCMIELIKDFRRRNISNVLITTENGKRVYEANGLTAGEYLSYITVPASNATSGFPLVYSYIQRTRAFLRVARGVRLDISQEDALLCHSDFFPNTIATWTLGRAHPERTYYWFHLKAPALFKGFEGEYAGTYAVPTLALAHYHLNQWLFFILARRGTIISINPYYERFMRDKKHYILRAFGGVKVSAGTRNKDDITYDVAFLGRFHQQKGVLDLPEILRRIHSQVPAARLLIIGGGDTEIEQQLRTRILEYDLENNVTYAGTIASDERFTLLQKARVFLFPSHYESYGLVALEAMANGLPVIAYDLSVFSVFKKGMIRVPVRDTARFADAVVSLLKNKDAYDSYATEAQEYAAMFSWAKTAEEVYSLISSI